MANPFVYFPTLRSKWPYAIYTLLLAAMFLWPGATLYPASAQTSDMVERIWQIRSLTREQEYSPIAGFDRRSKKKKKKDKKDECPKGTPSGPMYDFLKEAGKKRSWNTKKFNENIEALKSNSHFACTTDLIENKRKNCERTNDFASCLDFCRKFSQWQIGLANAINAEERTRAIRMGEDCKGIFSAR